ncbi:EFR1 family ferrodoxin [Clostridium gasigenes]|uniref:EFR1 family ferrodoxin n=1 Tax=Clostridium gasigenes TaxID=94869 RepID=UPI0014383174|nr:EFR1 family ferrodoxin [Clostridium gasigenes]NKF08274.1 4Fe-4S binding protein [Clostridium gasigenes]QSW20779.1 EFR1 family ferrodoxin [Clostridium gasigenes]
MGTKIFYFSSTGNSLYVAKRLKEKIENCELVSIPKAYNENMFDYNCEKAIIIFPLHCFGLPIIVGNFISKLKLNMDAYVFAVQITGGGSSRNSFIQIDEALGNNNPKLSNKIEIKYISNYIKAGKNPTAERAQVALDNNEWKVDKLIQLIKDKQVDEISKNKNPIYSTFYKIWRDKYKNKDKKFNVNDDCIGCKVCEKICPVNNIELKEDKPVWKGNCTDCMACINNCPRNAINIGKSTIKKNRYKNPYIKLEELL